MTDKQIKLDGSWIPMEVAIKAGLVSEKDIDVPSKRLDRIDKMEIDLANYEQMELDIEKIIEPYQLNWELDCLSLPSAIQSILERKEQECEGLKEEIKKHNDDMFKNPPEKRFYCKGCTLPYISKKLKQTLTEIKEHFDEECKLCKVNYINITDKICEECEYKQILQKISECEGNDE